MWCHFSIARGTSVPRNQRAGGARNAIGANRKSAAPTGLHRVSPAFPGLKTPGSRHAIPSGWPTTTASPRPETGTLCITSAQPPKTMHAGPNQNSKLICLEESTSDELLHPPQQRLRRLGLQLDHTAAVFTAVDTRSGLDLRQHFPFTLRNAEAHAA